MLRSILVGLDESPFSRSAVELAIRWARRTDALVVGLGVIDEPTIRAPEPLPVGASAYKEMRDEALIEDARRRVEAILSQFSLRCAEAGVASKVLEDVGAPAARILLESQRYDIIVLGQQTYFQFATQETPCRTLYDVLKGSPRPVVTAPERLGAPGSTVVAYDGSLQSARALQAFQASGLAAEGRVHLVSVHADAAAATSAVDRAADFLRFHDVDCERHVVIADGAPARVILDRAVQLNAGLLVMGAYGRSAFVEFFLGSVTRTLLDKSPIPMFLYH
jgi:nucleotide-binding universal stress UspA family protein